MNRQEFSQILKEAREDAGLSKYRVAKDCGFEDYQVGIIEDARNSFLIRNMFKYLNAIKHSLYIVEVETKRMTLIQAPEQFNLLLEKMRENMGVSQITAAELTGVKVGVIRRVENDQSAGITVDNFLKCVYGLGCRVLVIKRQ